jgi:FkbM family methyltransferase
MATARGSLPSNSQDRLGCIFELPSYAEAIALELFTFGAYERDTQKLILDHLPDSGTFIDVGANIGSISIPIARMRPDARIVSIEANPTVFDTLTRNIDINRATNIAALRELVGANSNTTDFYRVPASHFGMGSIGPQIGVRPVSLQQSTLDDVLAGQSIKQVDVIKIDVEGAELSVLQGAHHLLSLPRPPVVIFEFQDWAEARVPSQSAGDAQRFLLSKQFKLYNTADGSELTTPIYAGGTMILAIRNC